MTSFDDHRRGVEIPETKASVKRGAIDASLAEQSEALATLEKIVDCVWERLEAVLRDETAPADPLDGPPPAEAVSPVARIVLVNTARIEAVIRRLEHLHDRIDL